jgi:hypothetical protein
MIFLLDHVRGQPPPTVRRAKLDDFAFPHGKLCHYPKLLLLFRDRLARFRNYRVHGEAEELQ